MSIALLTQKYEVQLYGVLHCYDRLVFSGNLHPFCYAQANHMAATWEMEALHQRLDVLARQYCPVVAQFGLSYHWSIMQAEYATDIVFKNQTTLQTPSAIWLYNHERPPLALKYQTPYQVYINTLKFSLN